LFGCARMLMGIEEHGGGKQLVRFRTWPKFWPLAIMVDLVFALLGLGAAMDHAWMAWTVLMLIVGLFSFRLLQESAAAEAAILCTLDDKVNGRSYALPALEPSKVREA